MILKKYNHYLIPFLMFGCLGLLFVMQVEWSNISLFMTGMIWEYGRNHEKLRQRSQDQKYRFSFIKWYYWLNDSVMRWKYVHLFIPTLVLLPFFIFLNSTVFLPAIFIGGLFVFVLNKGVIKFQ